MLLEDVPVFCIKSDFNVNDEFYLKRKSAKNSFMATAGKIGAGRANLI